MAIETAANDKAMNALDGPPMAGRPASLNSSTSNPPICTICPLPLCGSVSTSMDANRAGRGHFLQRRHAFRDLRFGIGASTYLC